LQLADAKSLVDATTGRQLIDFTRASSGTFVGSDGLIRTAVTNLLLRSEEFDNAYWVKTNSSITQNAISAPNGTVTAEKIIEAAVTGFHYVVPSPSSTVLSGATVITSVYAKSAERTGLGIFPYSSAAGARFNLANGTVISQDSGVTAAIASVGDGWYRCSAAITAPGTSAGPWLLTLNSANATNYTGDGTSGIYLWGAQLKQSSSVGEYIPTTSTINSAPRFDHNPTTGESLGLLVEEQRTNSIRNNTMVGAVAGTPGTLPTNWGTSLAGLTQEIVGTGTEKGVNYIDLRFSGTSNATQLSIRWEGGIVAVADGQTWSHSVWAKLVSGTLPSSNAALSINLFTSGGTYLTDFGATQIKSLIGTSLARVSGAGTINSATAALARPYVYFLMANGEAVDFTIRIGLPQLEQGAFATSVIPTSTTAVTRSADVCSISGSNFSSWYRQDEGTVFAETSAAAGSGNFGVMSFNASGSGNNRIDARIPSLSLVTTGGTQVAALNNSLSQVAGQVYKTALVYAVDNYGKSTNGSTVATDTSGAMPVGINQLDIGSVEGRNIPVNQPIRRLTYWPTRLPNSTLQAVTQ
jgi:hypothetical protein